ncbi:radical SAM family heme chaperone HemW [Georgenia sp. Z1491]|uniref:radical SAM family heme chaperone HemW n=1 Tax=Georgenia sp. Z1491 TaxID=3416707 RepID=UPI003CF08B09
MADLPLGDPAPDDGRLPASAGTGAQERTLSVYLHVPFCAVRCGYCDFTTYTNAELGGGGSAAEYAGNAVAEVELAGRVLADPELAASGMVSRPASTVFLGGGTPTRLPVEDLARMIGAVRDTVGLADGAEVTTEANPDSVDARALEDLAAAGVTRVSFGMQSAVPEVLATLDRTHDPARVPRAVAWAREAGLDVSVDLIYGTPGESVADWRTSMEAALEMEPDHVSAYALVVERGTRMGAQVRRGELVLPDDDDQAEKYELADAMLDGAGYGWYEVSNWARVEPGDSPETGGLVHASRHNLAYWRGGDWWGVGPGAHSHVGGVRWWNGKHPTPYAARLREGLSPAVGREVLSDGSRELERLLLGVRLAEGVEVASQGGLTPDDAGARLAGLVAEGLCEPGPAAEGRARLTLRGRLLADAVVRELTD